MMSFIHNLFISARSNCTYTCPSDCVVTKYDLTHSGVPRSNYDLKLYITSLSKKNQEMDQLDRKIKSFDNLCITKTFILIYLNFPALTFLPIGH